MPKKLTYKEVKEYIENNSKDKLLSEEYINNNTNLEIQCEKGHIYCVRFRIFKYENSRCGICDNENKKLSYEYVKNYIEIESKSGYKLLSEKYNGNNIKLEIQCNKGHIYNTTISNFKDSKSRCKMCADENLRFKYEDVKNYIEVESNSGCKLLSEEYINLHTNLKIMCSEGHIFYRNFNVFKNKSQKCPICNGIIKYTIQDVKEYIENNSKDKLLSEEYINYRTNLKIQCEKGHIYNVTFDNFKGKESRCPICKNSKGEKKITEYLNKNNINFTPQYKIRECKNKNPLPFDFAILNKDNELLCLIEYQGRQHYEMVSFNSNKKEMKKEFSDLKSRDEIKRKYCEENNIKLIEIPYWEKDNIENILDDILIYKI